MTTRPKLSRKSPSQGSRNKKKDFGDDHLDKECDEDQVDKDSGDEEYDDSKAAKKSKRKAKVIKDSPTLAPKIQKAVGKRFKQADEEDDEADILEKKSKAKVKKKKDDDDEGDDDYGDEEDYDSVEAKKFKRTAKKKVKEIPTLKPKLRNKLDKLLEEARQEEEEKETNAKKAQKKVKGQLRGGVPYNKTSSGNTRTSKTDSIAGDTEAEAQSETHKAKRPYTRSNMWLCIHGIGPKTTTAELRDFFVEEGCKVTNTKILYGDRDEESNVGKYLAFANFPTEEDLERGRAIKNKTLNGNELLIQYGRYKRTWPDGFDHRPEEERLKWLTIDRNIWEHRQGDLWLPSNEKFDVGLPQLQQRQKEELMK